MRDVLNELSVAHQRKPKGRWLLVDGGSADVYGGGDASCALADAGKCAAVRATRATTPFLAQRVQVRGGAAAESVALAPDWLFGRGCLVHVRAPLALLRAADATPRPGQTRCTMPPSGARQAQPAPGAPGLLVATHFVYSMALKRKRSFRAFGWDSADGRNRTSYPIGSSCWRRSAKGILFSHTFFAQTAHKAVLCAMPGGDGPECACCTTLRALDGDAFHPPKDQALRMETTGGVTLRWNAARAAKLGQGCTDYQMFWD